MGLGCTERQTIALLFFSHDVSTVSDNKECCQLRLQKIYNNTKCILLFPTLQPKDKSS